MRTDDGRIARHFDRKATEVEIDDPPEPVAITTRLLELVSDVAGDSSVLDLGCGTGADVIRLLEGGAGFVTGIDLSPASVEVARRRVLQAGIGPQRARFAVGDAASLTLQPHDWVILDRVVCCYGEADRLLSNSLSAAALGVAFSVPESRGWRGLVNSISWRAERLWKAIFTRDACPGHVHDVKKIERRIEAAGFRKVGADHRGLWYAAVFVRRANPA